MNTLFKRLLTGIVLFVFVIQTKAQDIHFSQFFETPLLRNPSLAGIFTGDYRIQGVYRDQWNSFTNAYRTGSFNAEYKQPVGNSSDYITTGLQMLYDKAGTVGLTTTQLLPAVNYHKSLSDEKTSYISLGFMGGLVRKSIDMTKMTTNSQYNSGYDPTAATGETFNSPNFQTWDASVGLSYNGSLGADQQNTIYAGAAYHHLNRPKNSFYSNGASQLSPKYVFSAGINLHVDDYSSLTIMADHSKQGAINETVAGALYSYKLGDFVDEPDYMLSFGAFMRWKDAMVPMVKIDMHSMAIALSYDVNISQLKTASQGRGGFELSLCYTGFLDRDNSSRNQVRCPHF